MRGDGLRRLQALVREHGGLMATLLAPGDGERSGPWEPLPATESPPATAAESPAALAAESPAALAAESPAALAAAGPRAAGRREEYELLVEAIYEGYLLHYGTPRVVSAPEADLRLLAGDQLYAIGLARLVALGDTAAVAELADTITLSALAHGGGLHALAEAVWSAGARAVGWGSSEAHRRAKELAFAGAPGAIEAMRTSAAAAPTPP